MSKMNGQKRGEAKMMGMKRSAPDRASNATKRLKANAKAKSHQIPVRTPISPEDSESETFEDRIDEPFNEADGDEAVPDVTYSTQLKATGTSSKEAHAKQKALAQERKASKPNADLILRSKKLWERLRRKSHVPLEERKKLVTELFEIITGRVHDFVFKHDSVRVIQTALKYANLEQRKMIANELKGAYKTLAESRYAKFLIAKLMVHGDREIRDIVIPEFYGHVKRLIRHPEASWIVDDIYRTIATKEQKARLLCEWYGPEFVVFNQSADTASGELSAILEKNPEKRGPILKHLHDMTNQLVQKKTTGFTMLHDAMLQYFLNLKPDSAEFNENIQMILDDEEGDCLKNLAFTQSGSRLVCLTLAHATAKDRKLILRHYKGTFKLLAFDQYGHTVILAAFDVIDDTVMSAKSIIPELLSKDLDQVEQSRNIFDQVSDTNARAVLLYLFNPSDEQPKWLLPKQTNSILSEVHKIRETTSKKDRETRRKELLRHLTQPFLDLITSEDTLLELISSTQGTQFIGEALFGTSALLLSPSSSSNDAHSTSSAAEEKENVLLPALTAISRLPALIPSSTSPTTTDLDDTENATVTPATTTITTPHLSRLLKSLTQATKFCPKTRSLSPISPYLSPFADLLFSQLQDQRDSTVQRDDTDDRNRSDAIAQWATSGNSFIIVAMLERDNTTNNITFHHQEELIKILKTPEIATKIKHTAAAEARDGAADGARAGAGIAGAKILVKSLGL